MLLVAVLFLPARRRAAPTRHVRSWHIECAGKSATMCAEDRHDICATTRHVDTTRARIVADLEEDYRSVRVSRIAIARHGCQGRKRP